MAVEHQLMSQYIYLSSAQQKLAIEREIGPIQYTLHMIQQPVRSRASGVGKKPNRRTIDPIPIIGIETMDQFGRSANYPFLDTASLMLHVELVHHDTRVPVAPVPGSAGQLLLPLTGDLNSFVQRMNTNSEDEVPSYRGVFAFNDLSVRKEGEYRLQFHLIEIVGTECIHRNTIESDRFRVYQPKEFPGMQSSTRCTETLKKQGVKVRVKKAIRVPRGGAHSNRRAYIPMIREDVEMNFNPEPAFPLLNGPIQLPIPDHGRATRPRPLEYRGAELPEPFHQASYPSTPVPPQSEPYNGPGYASIRNFPFTFSSPPPTPGSDSFFQHGQFHERPAPYPPPQHGRYTAQPTYYHNQTTQWTANAHLPPIANSLPPISEIHPYTPSMHRYPDYRDDQDRTTGNHWHQNQY